MTPRTEICQIPLSIGFPRQEYWCGLLFPFFSRGYSGPRDWNCIPCIGRQILYHWATREAQCKYLSPNLLESKSISIFWTTKSFQVAQLVKNRSTHSGAEGNSVWSSGQEDPLEMATHSSILAETIPRSLTGYRPWGWVGHDWACKWKKKKKKTSIFCINLPGQL